MSEVPPHHQPRLRGWWPVGACVAAGMVLVALDELRLGLYAVALACGVALVVRLLPRRLAGGVVVRSWWMDAVLYGVAGAALVAGAMLVRIPR